MAFYRTRSRATLAMLLLILLGTPTVRGDLLGLYTFDNGLPTDSSGNDNHGTTVGTPTHFLTGGAVDNLGYYQFGRPITAYVQTPLNIDPEDVSQMTMGAWARIYDDTAEGIRMMLVHDDGEWDRELGTDIRGDGNGAGDLTYRWTGFTGNGPLGDTVAVDDLRDEWVFLAAVYDQDDQLMTLYVNDQSFESFTEFGSSRRNVSIGGIQAFPTQLWEGDIDNVFVFDEALSEGDIELIRLGGPEVIKILGESPARTLVQAWNFEAGTLDGFSTVEGTAFDSQPTLGDNPAFRNAPFDVGIIGSGMRGDYFVATYENHPSTDFVPGSVQGDGPVGIVETESFILNEGAQFDFLVGGGDHPWDPSWDPDTNLPPADAAGPTTVNLEREVAPGDWEVLFTSTGLSNEALHFVRWDASAYAGETVRLRMYDYNTGGWGHINVDDIRYFTTGALLGDYNDNGELDAGDLNLQAAAIASGLDPPKFDLNGDTKVDYEDRLAWVNDLKNTWIGDANLDLEFNSSDMVQVFAQGKYETGEDANWEDGNWDGVNTKFDSSDMVAAFAGGGYEKGLKARAAAVSAVPEPGSVALALVGLFTLTARRRRESRCLPDR